MDDGSRRTETGCFLRRRPRLWARKEKVEDNRKEKAA